MKKLKKKITLKQRQKQYLENAIFLYPILKKVNKNIYTALEENNYFKIQYYLKQLNTINDVIFNYDYRGFKHCEYFFRKEKFYVPHQSFIDFISGKSKQITINIPKKPLLFKRFPKLFNKIKGEFNDRKE